MIKKLIYLFFFLILSLVTGCSFDNKTGIWDGSESEKARIFDIKKKQENINEVVKIYSSENLYKKELDLNKTVTLSEPEKNSSWEMPVFNLQNSLKHFYISGYENNFLKKKIGKNKFSISKNISSPLIFDDNIIFADDTGTIFNINKRGKINWKTNVYKKLYKNIYKVLTFSVYKNKIYFADNIGFIYKMNVDNGEVEWVKKHGVPIKSKIKIFENKIFLINQDNRLISLNTNDGSLIWDIRSVSSFIKSQSLLSSSISKKGDLLVLYSSGDLVKIKTQNGRIYWTLGTLGSLYAHDTDFYESSDIVIIDDEIILSTSQSTLSFNLENGQLNWESEAGSTNTPIINKNNIFLVTDNGFFVVLDRKDGKVIRSTNVLKVLKKKNQNTRIAGYILGSSKLYIVTVNGYLIVTSAINGKVESVKKISDKINAGPIISNGELYILTENSKILAYR